MPPPRVSKHGTLNPDDVVDVVSVDVDHVVQHHQSVNAGHVFGERGELPPQKAQAVERRYTPYWGIRSPTGEDWVGLTKATSERLGTFRIEDLVPGEYKLVLKLDKQLNANRVTSITGSVLGGLKSLTVSADRSEEVSQRGMPTEYLDVRVTASSLRYSITDSKSEMDLGLNSTLTRTFTVRDIDVPVSLVIKCVSYSLVKRLKLQGQLLRCDLAPARKAPPAFRPSAMAAHHQAAPHPAPDIVDKARMGRELVNKAFSTGSGGGAPPSSLATVLNPDVPLRPLLVNFYATYAPEKVKEVDRVLRHFLGRDGGPDSLIRTLEEKYHVAFNLDGTWRDL